MLKKLQKRKSEGFTIIEVMIVLAIAGLILLIVLLAVPALQRNSRNTAIKNDAGALSAAINTFADDNDGKAPAVVADITQNGSTVTIGQAGTSQAEAKVQGGTTVTPTTAPLTPAAAITPGTITVIIKAKCDGTVSNRSTAIWYSIETSKGVPANSPWNNKCVES